MNILTFDFEEWFLYEVYPKGGKDFYLPIINRCLDDTLNLLEQTDTKATFFSLGVIARTYPQIIKKISARGHEIGCHSDQHTFITKMDPEGFQEDTRLAVDSIEQLIGEKVKYYRAPAFTITENTRWALEVLIEEGIECDCSIFPAKRSFGGFPSFQATGPAIIEINGKKIKELPISVSSFLGQKLNYSGGGYFRLLPYSLIRKITRKSKYNMSYFHLRDFDAKQKKIITWRYLFSYYGLKGSFKKFEKLLNDFSFITVGDAIAKENWDEVPCIKF